jgi:hypothetical protein
LRLPTTAELHRFCEVDGWVIVRTARGKAVGDHTRYRKVLADGSILRTKVSHGRTGIGDRDLFKHILRTQLLVSETQFWEAIDAGKAPTRPGAEPEPPPEDAVPFGLAMNLMRKVGVTQAELAGMSKEEAVARWQEWLTSGGSP